MLIFSNDVQLLVVAENAAHMPSLMRIISHDLAYGYVS
jgi:hypothetical protein